MYARVVRTLTKNRSFRQLPGLFKTVPSKIAKSRSLGGFDVGVSRVLKYGGTGLGAYALLTAGGSGIRNILAGAGLADTQDYDPVSPWTLPWNPFHGTEFPNGYNPLYDPYGRQYYPGPSDQGNDGDNDGDGFMVLIGVVLVLAAVFMLVVKK